VAIEATSSPGGVTERNVTVVPSESSEKSTAASTASLIADLKVAISGSGSRRSYAAFSKISDSVNEKNVREVLGFAEGLPREQDKSMLRSLLVGRWAEFDPKAAVAYAEALPNGASRNSALTSAVGGWAEHDFTAASALSSSR